MALTNEDLQAIKVIVDESVKTGISGLEGRVGSLESKFDGMESRLDGIDDRLDKMDARLDGMDARLDGMDARLDGMDARLDGMDTRLDRMDADIGGLKQDVNYIKVVQLENGALKILNDIAQNYSDTYERYRVGADKFDKAFSDIDNLKKTVSMHSDQIQELQKLKQA